MAVVAPHVVVPLMAVVRIKATKAWYRRAMIACAQEPRLARELQRAIGRPGRMAEVTAVEARKLHDLMPDATTEDALARAVASEARELVRQQALRAKLDERRGNGGKE